MIGAVGTGKTDRQVSASIFVTHLRRHVDGKVRTLARRSDIIPSYLTMLDRRTSRRRGLHHNGQDYEIKFPGRPKDYFVEDETKDRNGQKIKGINASASHIDEADELSLTMFTTAKSRKGRRVTLTQAAEHRHYHPQPE